jgi:hypothetical protein
MEILQGYHKVSPEVMDRGLWEAHILPQEGHEVPTHTVL